MLPNFSFLFFFFFFFFCVQYGCSHWVLYRYDILAGAVIGTVMAFSAYRMTYAAIWDWRINHIPLNRGAAFDFANPELTHATFTRKVGWGAGSLAAGGHGIGGHHGYGHGQTGSIGNNGVSRKPVGSGRGPEAMV
jgi:diacylglycerol diphosphate phosphatase / phosphatidate phosphatase